MASGEIKLEGAMFTRLEPSKMVKTNVGDGNWSRLSNGVKQLH